MSRISIDVTQEEHRKLKALAALDGKSLKNYVIERALGASEDPALDELESLLDGRIRSAESGSVSRRTVGAIFKEAHRKSKSRQNAALRANRSRR